MSSVAIVIATYGDSSWAQQAYERAVPSALATSPDELIVKHDVHGNASKVRNSAAWSANSKWLCFLDADDELEPGYLEGMKPFLAERKMLLAPYVRIVDGGRGTAHIPNAGRWPETNDAVVGTLIERDEFARLGGFRHEFWPWTDWELWLRGTIQCGLTKVHVPESVYVIYDRPGSENKSLTPKQGAALHARVKKLHQEAWK